MAFHLARLLLLLVLAGWIGSLEAKFLDLPVRSDARFRSSDESRCPMPDPSLNYQPVIGILSHPGDGANGRVSNATDVTNIPASYVKFVSSAGARVIPILSTDPEEVIKRKLNIVNGVLFTGGWATTGRHYDVAKRIFQMVLEKNDAGDQFPLFAIDVGFELLLMFISQNNDILETFLANRPSTLQFNIPDVEGTLFERFSPDLLPKLSRECLAMHYHQNGISPRRLQENNQLSSFFRILTTSTDNRNMEYVSTAQAHNYPVVALQWRPETNAFEWGSDKLVHTEDAVRVSQQAANYFIRQARKSSCRPDQDELLSYLIYNFKPTFTGFAGNGFDEVYIFT